MEIRFYDTDYIYSLNEKNLVSSFFSDDQLTSHHENIDLQYCVELIFITVNVERNNILF